MVWRDTHAPEEHGSGAPRMGVPKTFLPKYSTVNRINVIKIVNLNAWWWRTQCQKLGEGILVKRGREIYWFAPVPGAGRGSVHKYNRTLGASHKPWRLCTMS